MASAKDIETDVAVSRRGEEREERPREQNGEWEEDIACGADEDDV